MIGTQLRNCDFFSTIYVRDTIQILSKGSWKVDLENYHNSETDENPKRMKKLSFSPKGPIELKISDSIISKQELSRYELSECLFYLNKVKKYQI